MVYVFREAGRKELLTLVTDILHFFRYLPSEMATT